LTGIISRLSTALADRYTIERELGAGGMATVYLAHDLRHDRKVALKVLRPELAAVIGADRFLQEIRVTANLQHPHILPLFDSGEADTFLYYVMPYVEGEALRDRMDREKQLPTSEAVRIAAEAASALDYAHRRNVVHRDIKPENILLHDDRALVADFGIALALRAAGGDRLTETGLSLGTPQYMSPEQAMADRDIDGRTDIYSLGCVLYEMLAGEPPYTGATAQAIIGRLLTEEPRQLSGVRRTVPAHVDAAVHKALEKLPADRFADAADFAEALTNPESAISRQITTSTVRAEEATRGPARPSFLIGAALATAALLTGIAIGWFARPAPAPDRLETRFYHEPDSTQQLITWCCGGVLAASRDGRRIAYIGAERGSTPQLFVRDLDDLQARPLPGTEGARSMAFSPDGEWIVYADRTDWKKVAVSGGAPIALAELDGLPFGSTWTDDNTIVIATNESSGLLRFSADGGLPQRLTGADSVGGTLFHSTPHHVAGTDIVLFSEVPPNFNESEMRIASVSLKTGELKVVGRGLNPHYTRSGHLVNALAGGAVVAQPLDLNSLQTSGPLTYIAEGIFTSQTGVADFDVSESGTLVYMGGIPEPVAELVDRTGAARSLPVQVEGALHFDNPRFSPDGRRLALSASAEGVHLVNVFDVDRGTALRLTFGGNSEHVEWTPGGDSLIYARDYAGFSIRAADRSGGEQVLTPPGEDAIARFSVSRRYVAWASDRDATGHDIVVAHRDSLAAPWPYVATPFEETAPAISPDERWLAYESDETGEVEVYVSSFPSPGGRQVVSIGGGSAPVWGRDGRTLYYTGPGGALVAAGVRTDPSFAVLDRTTLFVSDHENQIGSVEYDVHPDGEHFVMLRSRTSGSQLVVVLNATAGGQSND
jgi:serine/threonine-protein kinase